MDDYGRKIIGCLASAALEAYRLLTKSGNSAPWPCTVSMTADGTDIVIGATDYAVDANDRATVYFIPACGVLRIMAGEPITAGVWIAPGADGKGFEAGAGDYVCGYALNAASGDGALFDMLSRPSIPYNNL